jgi:hypothetical protein
MYGSSLITIGADPEFFVRKKDTKEIVSFSGVFGHNKNNPLRKRMKGGRDYHQDFLFSEDNVAVEFAIPPANNVGEFVQYISDGLGEVDKILEAFGLERAEGNVHFFSDSELKKGRAWEFGCEPDFDVYSLKMKVPPPLEYLKKKKLQNMRTTGGHIHLGVRNRATDRVLLGRIADYKFGRWSLKFEEPLPRRILYGRAGSIRMTSYGIEYRPLGNFWVTNVDLVREAHSIAEEICALAQTPTAQVVLDILNKAEETKAMVNGKELKEKAA